MGLNDVRKKKAILYGVLTLFLVVSNVSCVEAMGGKVPFTVPSRSLYTTEKSVVDISGVTWWDVHSSAKMCPWVVEFYSDGCPYCRKIVSNYSSFATSLGEFGGEDPLRMVTAAAANCAVDTELCVTLNISKVPTIVFMVPSKCSTASDRTCAVMDLVPFSVGEVNASDIRNSARRMVKQSMRLDGVTVERCIDMRRGLQAAKSSLRLSTSSMSAPFVEITELHASDIAGAFFFAMMKDVPLAAAGTTKHLHALRNFLRIVDSSLPRLGADTLLSAITRMDADKPFPVELWQREVIAARIPFVGEPRDVQWRTCRGSSPLYRGFPCGMWLLFHSLTVNADPGEDSLKIIQDYVRYFFPCEECRGHFIRFAFRPGEDPVLQLWRAHNDVNMRLAGAKGASDPLVPKRHFPDRAMCTQCYTPEGAFDERAVTRYLRKRYKWNQNAFSEGGTCAVSPTSRGISRPAKTSQKKNKSEIWEDEKKFSDRKVSRDSVSVNFFMTVLVITVALSCGFMRVRRRYTPLHTNNRQTLLV